MRYRRYRYRSNKDGSLDVISYGGSARIAAWVGKGFLYYLAIMLLIGGAIALWRVVGAVWPVIVVLGIALPIAALAGAYHRQEKRKREAK